MLIFIRTDASAQIGTGHVMRCLALADALRSNGADVHFICRELHGNLNAVIDRWGFTVHTLKQPGPKIESCSDNTDKTAVPVHASWLETSWAEDMAETIGVIKPFTPAAQWLIVDHYALDHRWESGMQAVAKKIMVIDDLADRRHDCDLLLDQNYYDSPEGRYKGLVPEKCLTLLGPRFALLRSEFKAARRFTRMRGNKIARVLVYFGGNDPSDLSRIALCALSCEGLKHLLADVVVGPSYSYLARLKAQVVKRPGARLFVQPERFVELLLRADLCIGAGGTSIWERLCLNLPSIVIITAENQRSVTNDLHKAELVQLIGDKDRIDQSVIAKSVLDFINSNRIQGCYNAIINMVDGEGADRLAMFLINQ